MMLGFDEEQEQLDFVQPHEKIPCTIIIGEHMNYELEINKLKNQLQNLQDIVLQMSRNSVPTTSKVDDTANQVKAITPYTDTKTAYIGDTSVYFFDVPNGNLTVYGLDTYKTIRTSYNAVLIEWETPLEEVTEVTISIS